MTPAEAAARIVERDRLRAAGIAEIEVGDELDQPAIALLRRGEQEERRDVARTPLRTRPPRLELRLRLEADRQLAPR